MPKGAFAGVLRNGTGLMSATQSTRLGRHCRSMGTYQQAIVSGFREIPYRLWKLPWSVLCECGVVGRDAGG